MSLCFHSHFARCAEGSNELWDPGGSYNVLRDVSQKHVRESMFELLNFQKPRRMNDVVSFQSQVKKV